MLPPDLSDCISDRVAEDDGDEEEKQSSEDDGETSDVEGIEPQNNVFQQLLARSSQGLHDSLDCIALA